MGIFDSLIYLTKNVADVALAPVEIAVDATNALVKPVADGANELVKDVKRLTD